MAPDRMRQTRRRFLQGSLVLAGLSLLAGCQGVPFGASEPPKVPRIGVLGGTDEFATAFRQGLAQLGYAEGQSVTIDWRRAEGRSDPLPSLAAELVRLEVDVIVALGTPGSRAAKEATAAIPIVMAFASDPTRTGLVTSLARPGGNVTGLASIAADLVGKRLQLLTQALPAISRVGVLWNPGDADRAHELPEVQAAAQTLGLGIQSLEARSPEAVGGAVADASRGNAEAVFTLDTGVLNVQRQQIVDLAGKARLPVLAQGREYVEAGSLLCYGPNIPDMCRRAATYVDKILKGTKPADLPVEQPTAFDFIINLKTAQALGLTIPESILQQATEVIQ